MQRSTMDESIALKRSIRSYERRVISRLKKYEQKRQHVVAIRNGLESFGNVIMASTVEDILVGIDKEMRCYLLAKMERILDLERKISKLHVGECTDVATDCDAKNGTHADHKQDHSTE